MFSSYDDYEARTTTVFALSTFKVLVPFFEHGVPLAFAATAPSCRLAAETYRAEENSTWVAGHGLHTRAAGDRETFNVYEARRWRHVGVQIGPLITTFHDATGVNGMGRGTTTFVAPDSAEPWRSTIANFPTRPLEAGEAAMQRKLEHGRGVPQSGNLIRDEYYCETDFPAYAHDADVDEAFVQWKKEKQPPAFLDADKPLDTWSWTLTGDPDVAGVGIGQHRRRLFFYGGRNRRTVYLWMDGASTFPERGSPSTLANKNKVEEEAYADLHKLLHLTRWWFVRPPVSSMKYLNELYAERSGLTLPSPPSLYLHLYGADATPVPRVCHAYLHAHDDVATEEACRNTCAERSAHKHQQLNALFPSPDMQNCTALVAQSADGTRLTAASMTKEASATTLKKVELLPVLEGLFLVSHPPLSMQLTLRGPTAMPLTLVEGGDSAHSTQEASNDLDPRLAEVLVPITNATSSSGTSTMAKLATGDVGQLAILKLSGVEVDDDGLRHFLGVDRTTGDDADLVAQMPFLELLDVSYNINLRHFALVDALSIAALPPTFSWSTDFYSHLAVLNMQCTSITTEDVAVLAHVCPRLGWLNVACCQYLHDLSPVTCLQKLYYLDAHGTGVGNEGIAHLWECNALQDLNLSGCHLLTDVTALSRIASLRRVDLRDVLIRHGLQCLEHCPRLQQLLLAFSALSEEQMAYIQPTLLHSPVFSHMGALRVLYLVDTPLLTNATLASLAHSQARIEELQLRQVPHLTTLASLEEMDGLCVLGIQDAAQLTVEGIASIAELRHLRELVLRECPLINNFGVVGKAPRLRVADLSHNDPELNAKMLESLVEAGSMCRLQQLRIMGYPQLRGIGILAHLPSLEVLDASGCCSATMRDVIGFAESATLTALTLRGCCLTAPILYKKEVELCSLIHLRELDLSRTNINDTTLRQLTQQATQLEVLNLSYCTALRYDSPIYQQESLRVLYMTDHPDLTVDRLRQFFRLKRDAPARVGNPAAVPFPVLEVLDVSRCPKLISLEPFTSLPRLKHLEMAHTTVISQHLCFLQEMPSLTTLSLAFVQSLGSKVWPIFSHPALLRVDLRSAVLSPNEEAFLPVAILANRSPLREIIVTGASALQVLMPMLAQPPTTALRHLMLLVVETTTAKDVEACEALMAEIRTARPLLSTRYL